MFWSKHILLARDNGNTSCLYMCSFVFQCIACILDFLKNESFEYDYNINIFTVNFGYIKIVSFLENTTFYVVFVLKNIYNDVVFVTIFKQGKSDSIRMKSGQMSLVNEMPTNQSPFIVEAKNVKGEVMNINGKSNFSLTPQDSFGNLKLLKIDRRTPGKCFKKHIVVYVCLFKLIYEVHLNPISLCGYRLMESIS